jgi:hypothetical protein
MQIEHETPAPEIAPKRGRGRPPKGEVVDLSHLSEKQMKHHNHMKKWREANPEHYRELMRKSYHKHREARLLKMAEQRLEIHLMKVNYTKAQLLLTARNRLDEEPVTTDEDASD